MQKNIFNFFLFLLIPFTGLFSPVSFENDQEAYSRPDSVVYKITPQGELKMHLHYPADWKKEDRRPAMVFFFGGGWNTGKTSQFLPQAEYFAERGMVTARADYRVFSRHGTTPMDCVEDGKSAVRWIRQHAGDLGIDPGKIVSAGGSAGGHIAACTYLTKGLEAEGEDLDISSQPNLLVLFNPVMDTKLDNIEERISNREAVLQISPIDNLMPGTPPMIMFYGTEDRFLEPAVNVLEISDSLGLDVEIWVAEGQKHGFFNRSPWKEWTIFLADKFLQKHGYLAGPPAIELPDSVKMVRY